MHFVQVFVACVVVTRCCLIPASAVPFLASVARSPKRRARAIAAVIAAGDTYCLWVTWWLTVVVIKWVIEKRRNKKD